MDIIWLAVAALSCGLSYTAQFTASTLAVGRQLSGESTGTGYQDAISPPWQTKLAMAVYAAALVFFAHLVFDRGWAVAFGALAIVWLGSLAANRFLPSVGSPHFVRLIKQSMVSRYADYVRDGDAIRAEAMKGLLDVIGLNPDELANTVVKASDDDIIGDYGALLEKSDPAPGCVADVKRLPHPKAHIKQAIMRMLRSGKHHQHQRHLITGYMQLAYWQEGVGSQTLEMHVSEEAVNATVGMDFTKMGANGMTESMRTDLRSLSEKLAVQRNKWLPIIEAEQARLIVEISEATPRLEMLKILDLVQSTFNVSGTLNHNHDTLTFIHPDTGESVNVTSSTGGVRPIFVVGRSDTYPGAIATSADRIVFLVGSLLGLEVSKTLTN